MVRRMDLAALGGKDEIGASQRKMAWDKEGGWWRVRKGREWYCCSLWLARVTATDLDNRTRLSLSIPGRPVPDCPAVPVHGLAGAGRAKVGGGLH